MGCFTANSNSFITRPWEAQGIFSYSIRQPISRIFVEITGKKIMRILPYVDANEWISNKSRFYQKELIYIHPKTCVSVIPSILTVLCENTVKNTIENTLPFKKAVQLLLLSLSQQKFGLILNAYVDLKEASIIRSLDILLSEKRLKIYH